MKKSKYFIIVYEIPVENDNNGNDKKKYIKEHLTCGCSSHPESEQILQLIKEKYNSEDVRFSNVAEMTKNIHSKFIKKSKEDKEKVYKDKKKDEEETSD